MSTPKIDKRDRAAILAQLESLASELVPDLTGDKIDEWRTRKDVGYALMQIFSYMADHTVTQLNKVPEKKLLTYLNMIGANLLCAQPARTPINFILSQGALEGVSVPVGTQVATSAKDGLPAVVFETERAITATVSQLKAVISADPSVDEVFDNLDELDSDKKETNFFVSPPLQEHALYLGHESLFNLQKGIGAGYVNIELTVNSTGASLNSNLKWSFSSQDTSDEGKDWIDLNQTNVSSAGGGTEIITITKKNSTSTAKKNIDGTSTFWIRAKMDALSSKLPSVKSIKARIINEVGPDLAFYNDVPIDLAYAFYPFGKQPNTSDIFYIGSREGFSKKGSIVKITFGEKSEFGISKNSVGGPLLLSWEYWDGKSWSNLKGSSIESAENDFQTEIRFVCPTIVSTKVNSKENYWIRVRIVSGNYGANIVTITNGSLTKVTPLSGKDMSVPHLYDITIKNIYSSPIDLQHIVTKNNLQFNDLTNQLFEPFIPLNESNQTLYLGFDKPLDQGIISIFFALRKQEYLDNTRPRIAWSYFRSVPNEDWVSIQVVDTTDNLTKSGALEFLAPSDMALDEKFGRTLYWVRGEVIENRFQSMGQTVSEYIGTSPNGSTDAIGSVGNVKSGQPATFLPVVSYRLSNNLLKLAKKYIATLKAERPPPKVQQSTVLAGQPCNILTIYHPKFSVPNVIKSTPAAPIAYTVSLNTTLAAQVETVTDELLGISDGSIGKPVALTRTPVISESLWVREPILPNDKDVIIMTTATGEAWVSWQVVDDFFGSKENSRNYMIDRVSGQIIFGNGVNGMIPPVSSAIKATYKTGGGVKGNVALGSVKNLVTAIASIDKAINIDDAQGGAETETVERAKERGPKLVQHRHRAVAREDYEWLSMDASGDVARAKCIPNLNSEGKQQSGCVAIIIIPGSKEDKPTPSSRLLQIVEDYLKSHCPLSVASLTVTAPTYLGVSVTAEIYVTSIDSASSVKFASIDKIRSFLHPLYGDSDGKGWDFGVIPCNSDILAILQKIPNVDHIENLTMTISEEQSGNSFTANESIILPGYTLIYSSNHKIQVSLAEDA